MNDGTVRYGRGDLINDQMSVADNRAEYIVSY